MVSHISQFSVFSILYRKVKIISVNISINNFIVNFKGDMAVKVSSWFCGFLFALYCASIRYQGMADATVYLVCLI